MLTKIFGEPLLHGENDILNRICLGWHILCTVYLPAHFIAMIVMGSKYIDACPFDNWIPRLLIIIGIYGVIEEIFRRFILPLGYKCFITYLGICAFGVAGLLWDSKMGTTDVTNPNFLKYCSYVIFVFYCYSMVILNCVFLVSIILFICQYKFGMGVRSSYSLIPESNTTATP